MNTQLTEKEVLQQLDIPDFRHMTKDKVMTFVSMLHSMEPDVAKKAIEQFPEFSHLLVEALQDLKGVMEKNLDANAISSKQCFDIYNEIINTLKRCLDRDNTSFEERKYYIEKMMEIAQMSEYKDSENKGFTWKSFWGYALVAAVVAGVSYSSLGGTFNFNLPKLKI